MTQEPGEPEEVSAVPEDEAVAETVEESAETRAQRRRRLAEVFGEVLPEGTSDDRDEGPSGTSEEWLRGQVPPHHG